MNSHDNSPRYVPMEADLTLDSPVGPSSPRSALRSWLKRLKALEAAYASDAASLNAIRREEARVRAWLAEPAVATGARYTSSPARINGVDGLGFAVALEGSGDGGWKGVFSTTMRDGVRLFNAAGAASLVYRGVVYHGQEPVQERLSVVLTRIEARGRSVFVRFRCEPQTH